MVAEQHKQAARMVNDIVLYQQRGANAGALLLLRAYRNVIRAYVAGRDVSFPFREQFMRLHRPMRDAMIVAYLLGTESIYRLLTSSIQFNLFNVFTASKTFLAKRMRMPVEDLKVLADEFDSPALLVLQKASARNEAALQSTMYRIQRNNMHVREGKKELLKTFDALGLVPTQRHQLETIYRTQTQLAYAAGQHQVEQDPEINELIWGYEYVTTDDDRVRPTHAGMDGVKLPKDDPFWQHNTPPNGWNCRCQRLALFDPPEDGSVSPPEEFEGVKPGADKGFRQLPSRILGLEFPAPPIPPKPSTLLKVLKTKGLTT